MEEKIQLKKKKKKKKMRRRDWRTKNGSGRDTQSLYFCTFGSVLGDNNDILVCISIHTQPEQNKNADVCRVEYENCKSIMYCLPQDAAREVLL
ncbi:hypothetical protein CRG98_026454 [Punica granatum]|uniref:Uncharacterized protein n=1 Tax=Punica granatum TaxID=22663 RepID=A0A2I0JA64_PUNGR|nr:hypothetical protein CRG98_026454 [Punica granatum]